MRRWLRHRRAKPLLTEPQQVDTWQVISLLLAYPGPALMAQLPVLTEVAATLPEPAGAPVQRFLRFAASIDPRELQSAYVDTFDVTRKCCLHLTYFVHGDTRNRGAALVQFKQVYRRHGVVLTDEDAELPDHLCVVLEFGATVDAAAAWKLLNDHRVGIELLRQALLKRESPWADLIQALNSTLPELQGEDHQALARLIAEGPPHEEVGIDTAPYAIDPALESTQSPPAGGCGHHHEPDGPVLLGSTIDVGARR